MKVNFTLLPLLLLLFAASHTWAAESGEIEVYKSPTCGCCSAWADHLHDNGFKVKAFNISDMNAVKKHLGVSPQLASCHTAIINGYVIEGHVPATDIKRLLRESPKVTGVTVPGMPMGSPCMDAPQPQHYQVLLLEKDGTTEVFAEH